MQRNNDTAMKVYSSAAIFLKEITGPNGAIDLSTLKKFGGGGTHDIYSSAKHPELLLKVVRKSIGKDEIGLASLLQKLNDQYTALYAAFGESRCIVEERSVHAVLTCEANATSQYAIVSVAPFDPCFKSEIKFGFNVEPEETDGLLIKKNRYLYSAMNRTLFGKNAKSDSYVLKNYTRLNMQFERLFKLLDTEPSLVHAMHEFLTKYKSYYAKEGILLDTIGYDNVIFYKATEGWQFKLGTVIKHDTGALTKQALKDITQNPTLVKKSFEYYTSVYFMPACIRALNACAAKVGMGKIIEDIDIDDNTIEALAEIHIQLGKDNQAVNYAKHGKFTEALDLYREYCSEKTDNRDDTYLRGMMGVHYWDYIKKGGDATSREEVEIFLNLIRDPRNKVPENRQEEVNAAIEGLEDKLLSIDNEANQRFNRRTF